MIKKKVEVDFVEMVKMHEKLSNGEHIDPQAVSGLMLGGIIIILVQTDRQTDGQTDRQTDGQT